MYECLKKLVAPLHLKDGKWWPFSKSGYRIFSITILQYEYDTTPASDTIKDWTLLRVNGPSKGTHMFENALLHFALFLPFGVALTISTSPKKTFTFQFGWKTTGNLSGVCRHRECSPFRDKNGTLWNPCGLEKGKW